MANRIEIGESVENALGLNITGASVTVRFHGGAQAPVYDAQNGGLLLTQPLSTVNGKIGGDSPSGAWVAANDYDLDVVFGSDTLTFYWPADHTPQFVTALPAGAGTSAPEDGELAIELYDAANGGAWLRRWRSVVAAWDMIGGPPPSGNVLPGVPRVRQEFYLTGSVPTVQHLRYNGASWDYVGTPPMVPVTGSPLTVLDVGQANQIRAGRQLALADFNTLAALPTVPVGLFNLGSIANLGTGGALTNKGAVTFGAGIEGVNNAAAQFIGSTAQGLYIADTGAADPFRIKTGSWGAWVKTARRATQQEILGKRKFAANLRAFSIGVSGLASNTAYATVSSDGTAANEAAVTGVTDITDDRWHFVAASFDGTFLRLYVDGELEASTAFSNTIFASTAPFNIGSAEADGAVAASNVVFGRVDEAFVTPDIVSPEQVRLLYAAKIVHGYASTPRLVTLGVRRRRRGAALVSADFPSQPVRLYNFTAGALTDAGSAATALTASGSPLVVAGADGSKDNAYNFLTASTQFLQSTDAGLPAGTSSRSYGAWVKSNFSTAQTSAIIGWGTTSTNDARISVLINAGLIQAASGADVINAGFVADGYWHFVVVVEDNAAIDGAKRKLYVDGRVVGVSTTLNSITLIGAGGFRIGEAPSGTIPATAQIDEGFVFAGVLTQEQISVLYQKSAQALAQSPKEPGTHVEAMDASNVYAILDSLDTNYQIDMAVAA